VFWFVLNRFALECFAARESVMECHISISSTGRGGGTQTWDLGSVL